VDRHLVWNVVCKQVLYPFHRQKVQALGPNNYLCWDQFCVGLCTREQRSPTFLRWCCSQMSPASPGRRFSPATTAIFGQKQILMLHPAMIYGQHLGGHCVWLFD
jgi:hypothetical protein